MPYATPGQPRHSTPAIETTYKGFRFRSRLEARWAIFFDHLGLEWEYEPEGFDMGEDGRYLPDFRLCGTFAEVKFLGGDFSKAWRLAERLSQPVLLLEGMPDFLAYGYAEPQGCRDNPDTFTFYPEEKRLFWASGWDAGDRYDSLENRDCNPIMREAIKAARSARFEHGETPKPR